MKSLSLWMSREGGIWRPPISNAADSQEEDGQDLVDVMAGRLLGPVIDGGSLQQGRVRRELQVDDGEYTEVFEEVKGEEVDWGKKKTG